MLKRQTHAFTLIELLVVIAIVSLLVSVLIPSLNKAKELTRAAVCASNLHQIGVATALYTMDSNDTYPPQWGPLQEPPKKCLQVLLYDYVEHQERVFLCPTVEHLGMGSFHYREGIPASRMIPVYVCYGYNKMMEYVRHSEIRDPSSTIVEADGMVSPLHPNYPGTGDFNMCGPKWNPPFGNTIIADWHNGDANILFANQTVARHPSDEQYEDGYLYDGWWPTED